MRMSWWHSVTSLKLLLWTSVMTSHVTCSVTPQNLEQLVPAKWIYSHAVKWWRLLLGLLIMQRCNVISELEISIFTETAIYCSFVNRCVRRWCFAICCRQTISTVSSKSQLYLRWDRFWMIHNLLHCLARVQFVVTFTDCWHIVKHFCYMWLC